MTPNRPAPGTRPATIQDALRTAVRTIDRGDLAEARLVADVLLADLLGIDRAALYARWRDPLPDDLAAAFQARLERSRAGEPLAYLTGHREFYGLDLIVTPDVLIPRPETEQLVDLAGEYISAWTGDRPLRLADIGTGSGAIALALASRFAGLAIWAVDLSPAALAVARRNAERLDLAGRIAFLLGDLVEPLPEPVDLLIANLPYVPRRAGALAAETAGWEPDLALDGGPDGRRIINRLLATVGQRLNRPSLVLLEIGAGQGAAVAERAARWLAPVAAEVLPDAAGHDRVVALRLTDS